MLLSLYNGEFQYWLLEHKVSFDPALKLIYVHPDTDEIDILVDIYSDSKEWLQISDNARYQQPMRSVGGDPLPGGAPLGRTFFLTNGWRIYLDHGVFFSGNLYSDDYDSPFVEAPGIASVRSRLSNLIDIVDNAVTVPTAIEIAEIVWAHIKAEELKDEVEVVSAQVANVDVDVAAVSTQVTSVSTQVDSVSTAVAGVSTSIDEVKDMISITRALLNENSVTDQHAYDGSNNLLSARIRSYDTRANAIAATGTGLIQTMTVTATYDVNNRLITYRMVREGS